MTIAISSRRNWTRACAARWGDDGLKGILAGHHGHWTDTGGFRLAPHEPFYEEAAPQEEACQPAKIR
jgi:hypothetical protein